MKNDRNKMNAWCSGILVTCLLLIGFVSGCGRSESTPSIGGPEHGIMPGMTRAGVVEILGKPLKEKTHPDSGNMLILEYDKGLRIYLEDGKVVYFEGSVAGPADRGRGTSDPE